MDNSAYASSGNLFVQPSSVGLLDEYDNYCSLSMSSLLAQGNIPPSHKRVADNYMIIKRIYGCTTLQSRISNADKTMLARYDFAPLEYSTIKQINEELQYLQKWSFSIDEKLRADANELLQIRLRELKFIVTNKYAVISNELYTGYLALEKYFETISKY